jgi:hypothetical protein
VIQRNLGADVVVLEALFSTNRGERVAAASALTLVIRALGLSESDQASSSFVSKLDIPAEAKIHALNGLWNALFRRCYEHDFGDDEIVFPLLFLTLFLVNKARGSGGGSSTADATTGPPILDPMHMRVLYSRVLASLTNSSTASSTSSTHLLDALKLLGLLLAMPDLSSLADGDLGRTKLALVSISNLTTDPTTRALAEELLRLTFTDTV